MHTVTADAIQYSVTDLSFTRLRSYFHYQPPLPSFDQILKYMHGYYSSPLDIANLFFDQFMLLRVPQSALTVVQVAVVAVLLGAATAR